MTPQCTQLVKGQCSIQILPFSGSRFSELHTPGPGRVPRSFSVLGFHLCPHCLRVGQVPARGQQVVGQLPPGSGAQHVLKGTDGLAALCMGREPQWGWTLVPGEKSHSRLTDAQISAPGSRFGATSLSVPRAQRGMSV